MFTTDNRTENFLTSLGIRFKYRNGLRLIQDFAPGWNTENLGRPVAIREDAVIEYAALMEGGSSAPAPVLVETPEGFKVCDGVQRISAAVLLQEPRISAYVVSAASSEDALLTIRVLANWRMQGRAEPAEWTRRQAVAVLVVQRGISHEQVARNGGWKVADVRRIAEAIELQSRISNAGGPELSDAMLAALRPHLTANSALAQASVPIVGFLHTLQQAKLSVEHATPYIEVFFAPLMKSSNPHKTYTARLKEIQADTEIVTRLTGRQAAEMTKDTVLLRTLRAADKVLDNALRNGDPMPNVDEFYRLLDRIKRKLVTISTGKK